MLTDAWRIDFVISIELNGGIDDQVEWLVRKPCIKSSETEIFKKFNCTGSKLLPKNIVSHLIEDLKLRSITLMWKKYIKLINIRNI